MLSMWDLATTNTDCEARVLNSMAVGILSCKAGMAWGRWDARVNEVIMIVVFLLIFLVWAA